jgi:hypothetical protein
LRHGFVSLKSVDAASFVEMGWKTKRCLDVVYLEEMQAKEEEQEMSAVWG